MIVKVKTRFKISSRYERFIKTRLKTARRYEKLVPPEFQQISQFKDSLPFSLTRAQRQILLITNEPQCTLVDTDSRKHLLSNPKLVRHPLETPTNKDN